MGYRADGSGYIDINTNEDNYNDISKDVKAMCEKGGFSVFISALLPLFVDLECGDNYHEEEIYATLNEVSRKYDVISGEVRFTGEDNIHWRFVYEDGVWIEENGDVVYRHGKEHLYIVCIDEAYTRDLQVMTPDENADKYFEGEADEFDVEWGDYGSANVYLGYYWAKNPEAAKELAAMYGEDKGFMKVIDTGVTR